MIKIYLSRILGEKRWTQTYLSRISGVRRATINELYNEIADKISFEQLDRICESLDCDLAELLEYVPNKQHKTGVDLIVEDHGNQKNRANQNK